MRFLPMQRTPCSDQAAALQVFREVGAAVDSAAAWARYMALRGGAGDGARVVALQYVEGEGPPRDPEDWGACEGPARPASRAQLLSVDVAGASTGAFGDDLAIECLATAYGRDIYVVRPSWQGMLQAGPCVGDLTVRTHKQHDHIRPCVIDPCSALCGA